MDSFLNGAAHFPVSTREELVTIPFVENVIPQHPLTLINLLITWYTVECKYMHSIDCTTLIKTHHQT